MKRSRYSRWLAGVFLCPMLASANISTELEEACYGDVELADAVVELAETGATKIEALSAEELVQLKAFLQLDEYSPLSTPEKLDAVLKACTEGRLLQLRNQRILNPQGIQE